MKFLEGKTSTEKKKIAAAAGLGLIALISLYLAFGRGGSSPSTTAKSSPTPRPSVTPRNVDDRPLPTVDEQQFQYETTPVDYRPGNSYAPDPGRNIFAFYEPPPPCPPSICPPTPPPTPKMTPIPTPVPPPLMVSFVNPQSMYAGSQGFKLEVNGDKFTPDTKIYFNGNQLPTNFISSQKLTTDIPANFITQEGPRQITVQNADRSLYSNETMLTVQAPPRPSFQYIGMIARKRYNNDTAYFTEGSRPTPFGARLNDVVGGRFRLINITAAEVIFEDTSLGFKHRVPISKTGTSGGGGQPFGSGQPGGYPGYNPSSIPQNLPGVPPNVPRYVPPQPQPKQTPSKDDDVDDLDDGDG